MFIILQFPWLRSLDAGEDWDAEKVIGRRTDWLADWVTPEGEHCTGPGRSGYLRHGSDTRLRLEADR